MKCPFDNNLVYGKPHHAFFKSEYFEDDRDEDWNLIGLCYDCHNDIHHTGKNKRIEIRCKMIAYNRYKGKHKEELKKILRRKL